MQTLSQTALTDAQHDQIQTALRKAVEDGLIHSDRACELAQYDSFSATEELEAFNLLIQSKCRTRLKKHGIYFVTRMKFQDRLHVISLSNGWQVENQTKGTIYRVTERGHHLDCECDEFSNGFYKHRDAVEAFRMEDSQQSSESFASPLVNLKVYAIQEASSSRESWILPPSPMPELMPGFTPTSDQWRAMEVIKHWWLMSDEPFFRLTGYAGTGKSSLIQAFIKWLKTDIDDWRTEIGFAAPTNKAAKVQAQMLERWGIQNIYPVTCAKLFGIKERKTDDGQQIFIRDDSVEPEIRQLDLVVVDECSMISQELWEYFIDESLTFYPRRHRFILMGDPAQLPPVNESESMAFSHECLSAILTEVKRYGGAIGQLAATLRSDLGAAELPVVETDVESSKGVWACDRPTWEAGLIKAFQSEGYIQNPAFCRALAWRNKRVDYLNDKIRAALGHTEDYAIGERLIAMAPYGEGGSVILPNATEATVIRFFKGSSNGWPVWYLTLQIDDMSWQVTVPVLQNAAKRAFEHDLTQLRKEKRWSKYWDLRESFAQMNYAYALTIHKSQGSTFTHVFADFNDITANRRKNRRRSDGALVMERNQLAYVAATRASDRLFVLQ